MAKAQHKAEKADDGKLEALLKELNEGNGEVPSGYETRSDDLVGIWHQDSGPIHLTPLYVILSDNSKDENRPSFLVCGTLETPRKLVKDGAVVKGEKGDLVGVWFKAGMRGLETCRGVKTTIKNTGELTDTGKGNPMIVFLVEAEPNAPRSLLPVHRDVRAKSRGVATPFDTVAPF